MSVEERNGEFLKSSRAHIFERLTAVLDFFNAQSAKPNLKQVKARFSFVPKLCEEYEQLEAQILLYNSQPRREEKLTYRNERKALDDVVARIHEVYEDLLEKEQNVTMQIAPSRLPKLQLPKFSGNFREWQAFKEIYEAMIHSAPLPQIEKFQRLKGCLQGEPRQLIEHFPLTGETYPIAYQTLTNRYDNPRVAANSYLSALLNFKPCQGDSHSALQGFLTNHLDTVKAYKVLDIGDHYDYLLFQICYGHLDKKVQRAFDEKYPVDSFPTYDNLMQFVQDRLRTLELHAVELERGSRGPIRHNFNVTEQSKDDDQHKVKTTCYICPDNHPLVVCPKFRSLSLSSRYDTVKRNHLCFNCFRKHPRVLCNSAKRCKKCGKTHHTLLHSGGDGKDSGAVTMSCMKKTSNTPDDHAVNHTVMCSTPTSDVAARTILLSTAQGCIVSPGSKSMVPVRILLDPGSQVSCISQKLVASLGLPVEPKVTHIKGVSDTAVQSPGKIDCTIYTSPKRTTGFRFNMLVLPKISACLPELKVHEAVRHRFSKCKLADPHFDQPGHVDVLIGADYYYDLISNRRILKGKPNGIPTLFGMVLAGEVPAPKPPADAHSFAMTLDTLNQTLTKFWETEEPSVASSPEDEWCEQFFKTTLTRTSTGRYVVALPFTCDSPEKVLGANRENALHRLLTMERRFQTHPTLRQEYKAFMAEYLVLGHMTLASHPSAYVIPHHAVFKESTTTKLRVVFDASNESTTGVSLNQLLRTRPKLQRDVWITISGFRKFKIALVADIKMMYRQILVREQDRPYQRIFWRDTPEEDPKEFELNTVTYGLACSPYLAQRIIQQLVEDDGETFPLASRTLLEQIYVDDIVAGADTVPEALQLYSELVELLGKGGLFPRKWSSSSSQILKHIPAEHQETPLTMPGEEDVIYKVLGVRWDSKTDSFTYEINPFQGSPTKRMVLSYIARMFDPLGWLTPFTFSCKHFVQLLWMEGLKWDDPLPSQLVRRWNSLVCNVQCLSQLRIPRYVPVAVANKIQILGFCDASERGFAAVLYLRCIVGNTVTVHLLGGKSKVAPVKPLSIPRLELNAAHLLARLFGAFKPFLDKLPPFSTILFSDSQVVLGWLKTPPHKLKTYVCNRVVYILNKTAPHVWTHVRSEENAADCASRGLEPMELTHHLLWWKGPESLHRGDWEPQTVTPSHMIELPELKRVCVVTVRHDEQGLIKTCEKFSSLTKLTRVLAYVLRFVHGCQRKSSYSGPLKVSELKSSLMKCVWLTQVNYFHKERTLIKNDSPVNTLQSLSPFLDENDFLRVGGRLGNAPLPYEVRHPLLIPHHSHLARLIVDYYHKLTMHGGPQITRTTIQRRYWVPRIGNLIKSVIFHCKPCRQHNPKLLTPPMGDLPPSRFDQIRPFLQVGTDFAGPFTLKETVRRKSPLYKAYLCLFICFSTKAVHLEVVTSLTTDSFLAALDRFVARRGICAALHSDNGTNFTGAARKLSEVTDFLTHSAKALEEQCTLRHIQWKFNPPAAPHMGGLWEAAVKSFKYHLDRITTSHTFTLEEFSTLTCRIEAILNSRPLAPLSTSPSDAAVVLTPGHFLIGAPLIAVPELPLTDVRLNALSRWQLIAQCTQQFWTKWSRAYLQTLLPRKKWHHNQDPIKVGDVVFITKEKTNPLSWPMARVEKLLPGKDGVCRVVKIRCADRVLIRPVHTLSRVFEASDNNQT